MQTRKDVRQAAREMLRGSFVDGRLAEDAVRKLVNFVIEKKPRNYVKILDHYRRLLRLEIEKRHARIETASELNAQSASQLALNLSKRYGSDLSTEFVVNTSLLGGMRIRVGSDVWDSSVRNRLERLQQQL
ncbi:MAG: F0F1 ATP synthase subunit delta [Verrucomicrobiota bacterium]|nr:F0F1 ATP synthase subunit delta [Verrucomicrobiota bacterium]